MIEQVEQLGEVPRFDVVTRVVHWTVAALVGVMVVTGTILYVGQLSAAVGRRELLGRIHVWSGVALMILGAATVLVRTPTTRLRAEITDLGHWTRRDRRWLRKRTREVPLGKYNGGQKLATAAFGALLVAQIVSGSVMRWHDPFRDSWRTGATFVHDWGYLALAALVVGHVVRAIGEPQLLRAMVRGTVPRRWAETERPGWFAQIDETQT